MTALSNKVAVVTGADGVVGKSICKTLSAAGAQVAGVVHRKRSSRPAIDGIVAYGVNLADFASCRRFIERIEAELGPIDIVVNCAESAEHARFTDLEQAQWEQTLSVSLDSVFNITRHIVAGMSTRGFGRIINISSISGQRGEEGGAHYAAAKAGMHGFTMALAQEVARKGITVNTVAPGYIATERLLQLPDEAKEQIVARIPARRLGDPSEVANLVEFLASDRAAYITGEQISLSGGEQLT
jgi:acetoacetyl-CoA reductase